MLSTMAEPMQCSSPPKPPLRAGSADSQSSAVFRDRRLVRRAENLLTTRGEPSPAIATFNAQSPLSSPPLASPPSHNRHTRVHSNSVPNASSASASSKPGRNSYKMSRRRSDGSASLGFGGSLKRKFKEGGAYISRSLSTRSQHTRAATPNDVLGRPSTTRTRTLSSDDFVMVGSISPPASPRPSPVPRAFQTASPPQNSLSSSTAGAVQAKRHGRSFSDSLWRRPRGLGFSTSTSDHHVDVYTQSSVFADSMPDITPTGDAITTPPLVSSPPTYTDVPPQVSSVTTTTAAAVQSGASPENDQTARQASLPTIHEPTPSTASESSLSPLSPDATSANDLTIPPLLLYGLPMLKVSAKKQKRYFFRLDADEGQIIWQSKKLRISECLLCLLPRLLLPRHHQST